MEGKKGKTTKYKRYIKLSEKYNIKYKWNQWRRREKERDKEKKKTHLKPTDSESSEKFKQAIEKPHLSTQ